MLNKLILALLLAPSFIPSAVLGVVPKGDISVWVKACGMKLKFPKLGATADGLFAFDLTAQGVRPSKGDERGLRVQYATPFQIPGTDEEIPHRRVAFGLRLSNGRYLLVDSRGQTLATHVPTEISLSDGEVLKPQASDSVTAEIGGAKLRFYSGHLFQQPGRILVLNVETGGWQSFSFPDRKILSFGAFNLVNDDERPILITTGISQSGTFLMGLDLESVVDGMYVRGATVPAHNAAVTFWKVWPPDQIHFRSEAKVQAVRENGKVIRLVAATETGLLIDSSPELIFFNYGNGNRERSIPGVERARAVLPFEQDGEPQDLQFRPLAALHVTEDDTQTTQSVFAGSVDNYLLKMGPAGEAIKLVSPFALKSLREFADAKGRRFLLAQDARDNFLTVDAFTGALVSETWLADEAVRTDLQETFLFHDETGAPYVFARRGKRHFFLFDPLKPWDQPKQLPLTRASEVQFRKGEHVVSLRRLPNEAGRAEQGFLMTTNYGLSIGFTLSLYPKH